ncbi:MAG: hypothetical protein RR346_05360 [Bacteroidales bacterium]
MRKKRYLLLYFIGIVTLTKAQNIQIISDTEIKQTVVNSAYYPVFKEDGSALLFSTLNYQGLYLYSLLTESASAISEEPGSGYEPVFENGNILFKQDMRVQGRRYKSLNQYNASNRSVIPLTPPLRYQKDLQSVRRKASVSRTKGNSVFVTTEDLKLVVYNNGLRKELAPIKEETGYIWPVLSPDKTKILFTAATKGTFVCDLNGVIISSLGDIEASCWYNNEYVVGMKTTDNGDHLLTSSLWMLSLDGKTNRQLTENSVKAMYPSVAVEKGVIAYNTFEGAIRIMKVTIR